MCFSKIINRTKNSEYSVVVNLKSDSTLLKKNMSSEFFKKLAPQFSISLERFFKIKSSALELRFILWLFYLSICEYEIIKEKSSEEVMLSDSYFEQPSQRVESY